MGKENNFTVTRNYNYTITISDSKNRKLHFRDICGKDLEFLESCMVNSSDKKIEGEDKIAETNENKLTFEKLVLILNFLNTQKIDFNNFSRRIVLKIFACVNEHILCNYMTKYFWLSYCYAIQNGSFFGVLEMERVPMTKFIAMTQVHKEAVEAINKDHG